MRKVFLILIICLLPFLASAQQQSPVAPDTQDQSAWFSFDGQWLPNVNPALIGAKNYKTLQNMRYVDGGLEGVSGYTKINTTALTTYLKARSGFHFKKDEPAESHVLVQAYNTGLTASQVLENETAIPSAGDFSATALHTDASGAGLGRFSQGPQGTVLYANGVESMVWGGDEAPVSAFITSTAAITNTLTNPRDYTEAVRNTLTDTQNVATVGGGIDANTILMFHMDGTDAGTTFTDSSASSNNGTAAADAQTDTAQFKFGTASGLFDGTGDYVSVDDDHGVSDYFEMGTDPFTIDFWVRFSAFTAVMPFFDQYDDDTHYTTLWYDNNNHYLRFGAYNGAATVLVEKAWTPVINTWYHVSIIRGWGGSANAWALTVNGAILGTTVADADGVADLAAAAEIGRRTIAGPTYFYHSGWIDEFRVSKGIARWTSNFTVPTKAYFASSLYWVVGSTRPLQGVKYYIQSGETGGTLSAQEWTGTGWSSLSITDNTSGLSTTGAVTWSSTVNTSQPRYLNGYYLYFYYFSLDAGNADIYYITVDSPFQSIKDIWDGVYRQPIQFQVDRAGVMEDYTLEVNQGSNVEYPIAALLGGITSTDEIYVMFDERMSAIKLSMIAGKVNALAVTLTVYYWDGSSWISVSNLRDLTLDSGSTKTLFQTGVISWSPPNEESEFPRELYGVTGYAYKIVPSGALTDGTEHDGTSVDLVTGIPAPQTVRPFKFPALYKNRSMLCGFTESNEGNRCDYSASNAPNTFNGYDSSMNGLQSLYFGGEEELTAATQLYNRFGSNIFATLLVLKDSETYLLTGDTPEDFKIYPTSLNVGCPAPLTLASAELGYEVAEDAQRNVAFWLSYSGPMMFDGAVLLPMKGIENYFDPQKTEYISTTYIENSRGWYDQTYKEYNLLIPSGSGQATCNKWFVYNLKYKKWYEKVPAAYPQLAFQVQDFYGAKYIYGTLETGYMMRLEYGNTWNSTAIDQVIETGDFAPTNNLWDLTRIRRVKLAGVDISEAIDVDITHYADTNTDGTTLEDLDLFGSFITNGTMEANSNWSNFITPTTNERSSTQAHGGTYSRKFIADSALDGIVSDDFTTVTGEMYSVSTWVYSSSTSVSLFVRKGTGGASYNVIKSFVVTANTWNKIFAIYTESGGGASAAVAVADPNGSETIYVDDVEVRQINNKGGVGITRVTANSNNLGWLHRLKFNTSSSTTAEGFRPIGWGYQYRIERQDN